MTGSARQGGRLDCGVRVTGSPQLVHVVACFAAPRTEAVVVLKSFAFAQ